MSKVKYNTNQNPAKKQYHLNPILAHFCPPRRKKITRLSPL